MKRKEETVQAAKQREKEVGFTQQVKDTKGVNSAYGIGFLEGAEWADKTMIERAVEWISLNAELYGGFNAGRLNDLVENFKQAMEE